MTVGSLEQRVTGGVGGKVFACCGRLRTASNECKLRGCKFTSTEENLVSGVLVPSKDAGANKGSTNTAEVVVTSTTDCGLNERASGDTRWTGLSYRHTVTVNREWL